jgi:hypothetical protein
MVTSGLRRKSFSPAVHYHYRLLRSSRRSRNVACLFAFSPSLVAAMAALVLTAGCTKEAPREAAPAVHPDILIVLSGAEDVRHSKDSDGSVSYRLIEPYPADGTLTEIRSRLERQGWKPTSEDFMNPGTTNSHDRGWMNYIDGTRNDATVFHWSAAWESTRGDRVEYSLRYEYAKDAGPFSAKPPLQLTALYMTAPTVNIIRGGVRRGATGSSPK